ncbi:TPA: FAD-dependent oxidoreductase [Candidatus Latescibacteria bacterium]|nr:FAD-dependent oxidoreductase [Candidatus Latescibacterota bacterium]
MDTHREQSRDIPVVDETDVVVCGGGPAGVAAAIACARQGVRTRLIELHGCLGGVWTTGALSWIIDSGNKPGLMAEITARLDQRDARRLRQEGGKNYAYDVEEMKLLLDEMCLVACVEVRMHTRVVAAARDTGNRLSLVITESKAGREAWHAKVFIDATGDGDLGALAGCGFDMGHPETGAVQPMSLMALVAGIRFDEVESYVGGSMAEPKQRLGALMTEIGVAPSYGNPTLFRIRDDLFALMSNHQYGVTCDDAYEITAATIRGRREVHTQVEALRKLGGIWSEMRVVSTGAQIGVREGRRIHGQCEVTGQDLLEGARFEDAVCRVTMGIDVHSTDSSKTKIVEAKPHRSRPYDIPLRALIAKDVDGLLMAGRCISGDFIAHSSYRVTGNAVAMGQAAGICAARAVLSDLPPHEVAWGDVKTPLDTLNQCEVTV